MKKYRYRFHPNDYALGENEKFYSDMEAAGWRLVKRGTCLSKFTPAEPSAARYRIEVASRKFMEAAGLPDEQMAVYEDCGWEYVTDCGLLYIFRAPEGSEAPEFYADPRQQAATLKSLRRQYITAWLPVAIVFAWNLSLAVAMRGDLGEVLRETVAKWERMWVTHTAFCLGLLILVVWSVYHMIRGAVRITHTYRRMKKGVPLDHDPKGRHIPHKIVNYGLLAAVAACGALFLWELVIYEKYDLPTEADGPYLMLSELGFEGERGYLFYSDNDSEIEYARSLLSEFWWTEEVVDLPDGGQVWMNQYVYRLYRPEMAEAFTRTLMENAIFIRDPENFEPIEAPGLDAAWIGALEVVAIKDGMAAYIVCSDDNLDNAEMIQRVLTALAEKWA